MNEAPNMIDTIKSLIQIITVQMRRDIEAGYSNDPSIALQQAARVETQAKSIASLAGTLHLIER